MNFKDLGIKNRSIVLQPLVGFASLSRVNGTSKGIQMKDRIYLQDGIEVEKVNRFCSHAIRKGYTLSTSKFHIMKS